MAYPTLPINSIQESVVLTHLIEDRVNEAAVYNVPFAPLVATMEDMVKIRIRRAAVTGLSKFVAKGGSTPIVGGAGVTVEVLARLLDLSEMEPVPQGDIIALNSTDQRVASIAAESIVGIGTRLRERNIQRTIWLAWMAARGGFDVVYPDGGIINIDYDLAGTGHNTPLFKHSHIVKYNDADFSGDALLPWDHQTDGVYDADVITQVTTWVEFIERDCGVATESCILHLNGRLFRLLQRNKYITGQLSPTNPRIVTPTREEIARILGLGGINVENGFYEDEEGETYKWIGDEYIHITAPYQVRGNNIMEMKDGPVVLLAGDDVVVANNPGAAAEMFVDAHSRTKNVRVSTSRLPIMLVPGGFLYGNVVALA